MRKTKLIALLMVVAMIASMVVFPSVAAEEPYTLRIVDNATGASTINANAGDKIMLKLVLSNNPGISSIAVDINYPEDWAVTGAANKKLFNDTAETTWTASETYAANPYYSNWIMPYGTTEDPFNDVAINVYVTWKDAEGKGCYKTFTLGAGMLQEYAGAWDTKMIVLTITGIEDITELDCTARGDPYASCRG